jgi:O-succinylbenzoate synthase
MKLLELRQVSLAFKQPLALSRGYLSERPVLLLKLDINGQPHWAEAAPLPDWSFDSFSENLEAALSLPKTEFFLEETNLSLPAALSSALWLVEFASEGNGSDMVDSNTLITGDQAMPEMLGNVVKLKVGKLPFEKDIQRIQQCLSLLSNGQKLRLDANRSWSLDDVQTLEKTISNVSQIDYIEEPLRNAKEYERWQEFSALPFALDESLMDQECFELIENCLPKALVLKPTILGSKRTQRLFTAARELQLDTIISSSFESPVGLKNLTSLAAQVAPEAVHGLATHHYLVCDTLTNDPAFPLNHSVETVRLR